jgi:hypothetical protein
MLRTLRELIERRDLLYILAWREVKIRYKQSIMGMLWAVLMPLVIVAPLHRASSHASPGRRSGSRHTRSRRRRRLAFFRRPLHFG